MNAAAPTYRKLPGRGLSFGGFGRLWLAEDHILEVQSFLFDERYRRFFVKDIAGLVVRRTKAQFYWNIAHGVLGFGGAALVGVLVHFGDQDKWVPLYVFAVMIGPFAALFLILFFVNSLLGPSCRCHLFTTSSGTFPLAAPTRLRAARRLLAQLAPVISAAQSARLRPPPAAVETPA